MSSLINTTIKPFRATAYHDGEFVAVADHYATLQRMSVEVYPVSTDTHCTHKAWHDTSDTIRKIQAAQYGATHDGEVCPAKWRPGEKTLAASLDLEGCSCSSACSPTPVGCAAGSRWRRSAPFSFSTARTRSGGAARCGG